MNKILIVHTSWYEDLINSMLKISIDILSKDFKCVIAKAPGAIELASLANHKMQDDEYIGIMFLGIVVRGETTHYDLVTSETFRSIGSLSEKYFDKAIINNVLCVENKAQLRNRLEKNTSNNASSLIQLVNEKSS